MASSSLPPSSMTSAADAHQMRDVRNARGLAYLPPVQCGCERECVVESLGKHSIHTITRRIQWSRGLPRYASYMQLAFIGLGRMGSGMARNLLRAGHRLTVYNRSREKAEAIGATVASSPAGSVPRLRSRRSRCSPTIAPRKTSSSAKTALAALPSGAAHIACSTISTAFARRLAAPCGHATSARPCSGGPKPPRRSNSSSSPPDRADLVDRFRPVFEAMGRQTFVAGAEPWQANAVKLCGNFMIASMIESFGEAYGTLRKASVDPHLFLDVMSALFGSPVYANYGRIIADEAFEPAGFALKLGLKDMRLVLETAFECASPMPIASVLRDRLLDASAHGQSDHDWSSVAAWGR